MEVRGKTRRWAISKLESERRDLRTLERQMYQSPGFYIVGDLDFD